MKTPVPGRLFVVLTHSAKADGEPEWTPEFAAADRDSAENHESDLLGDPDVRTLLLEFERVRPLPADLDRLFGCIERRMREHDDYTHDGPDALAKLKQFFARGVQ